MIELRNFFTKKTYFDAHRGESYKRLVMVLQYRHKLLGDKWSEWIDVPDVLDSEENQ